MKTLKSFCTGIFCLLLLVVITSQVNGQKPKSSVQACYAKASYNGLAENEFMKEWWVAGPVLVNRAAGIPDDKTQKAFFDQDLVTAVDVDAKHCLLPLKTADSSFGWRQLSSQEGIVNLASFFGPHEYCVAYALAEIKMDAPAKIPFGIGSDDGIKIFVNGKLVHSNWVGRGTNPDDDLVSIDLQKGSNQILVKVQNMTLGWSFAMRKIGNNVLNELLVQSAGNGNLDNVKLLIDYGSDVNFHNNFQLSAYQNATIHGRDKVMELLKLKGARTDEPLPPFEKLADGIFKKYQSGNLPGVSVLVSKNGEIMYQKGFGNADVGNKVPVNADTKFKIGSITKQFTATAILKLNEEGKLSLNDKLDKYIPSFPRGNEVTVKHLLNHTSGIHPYTDRVDNINYVSLPISIASLIDTIKKLPFDFSPGERYQYNNSGFVLLGYIVEKVSGKSLAAYLEETLWKPLGMTSTGIYSSSPVLSNEAYGYAYNAGLVEKATFMDMSWAAGAGAMYSTAGDLFKWNEALFAGKVLKEESLKAAFAKTILNNGSSVDYGFGWGLSQIRGLDFVSHGGSVFGFLSDLERQPNNNVNIIVLSNSAPPASAADVPGNYSRKLAEFLLWSEMGKQSGIDTGLKPDKKTLESYTGRYNYHNGAVLIVWLEGDQLMAALTGQPAFPIFPSGKDEFRWKVVDASVTFVKNEQGIVTHATHRQGGSVIDAPKLADETPVEINAKLFDQYAGKYQLAGKEIVLISRIGDQLMVQYSILPPYRLLPASETEFFAREVNVRLKFHPVDNSKADYFSITIDGIDQKALRIAE